MTIKIPDGKLNEWCIRRGLVSSDRLKWLKAQTYLNQKDITKNERAAFYIHELFECQGLEFVAFSNARFEKTIFLPENINLVPCFYPEDKKDWNDPLVRLTFRMVQHAKFIYDGWLPIQKWDDINNVRNSIRKLDEILSLFAAQERIWFTWEPKYFPSQLYPSSNDVESKHIHEIEVLKKYAETWNKNDSDALFRSLAWLSQSYILPQPTARFLFCILSIESLATYIENVNGNSIFSSLKYSYPNTNEEKDKCIDDVLNQFYKENKRKAINEAYSNCLSITKMLKAHLCKVFEDDPESYSLLFESENGESLYQIRHKIAHGSLDALSDFERQKIEDQIYNIEKIAMKYIQKILTLICDKPIFQHKMYKTSIIPATEAISSHEGMYTGPVHMAEYYTYVKK